MSNRGLDERERLWNGLFHVDSGSPRLLFGLGAAAVAVVVLAVVAAAVLGGGTGQKVATGAASSTTASPTSVSSPSALTSSVSPAPAPVTPPPGPAVTTPTPAPAPTAPRTPPSPSQTAVRPAPGPPASAPPPAPPAPSPTPAPGPAATPKCAAGDVDLGTTTDAPSYAPGTTVKITTTAKNISSRPCTVANSCLYRRVTVQDSSTPPRLVYDSSPAFSHDICPLINEVPRTLNPGEVFIDRFDWDQRSCARADKCPGDPVPPGTYTVQGHWEQGTARPATFQVATGSPSTTAPPPAP